MNLQHFFSITDASVLSNKTPIVVLRSNQYSLFLCSLITERLATKHDLKKEFIDLSCCDEATFVCQCATTFLGQRSLYWLYNYNTLEGDKKKRIEKFLAEYQGPHCLTFFSSSQTTLPFVSSHVLTIDIPDMCDKEHFLGLIQFCEGHIVETLRLFAHQLFATITHIPFDTACLMVRYGVLLGAHYTVFMKYWLHHFVTGERSLFTLSQHLFAKNGRSFFALWSDFASEYSDLFWISFWSEQLWRAALYTRLMQQNNRLEAEKVGSRLPFAFKNKEWVRWNPAELVAAHSFLQSTDALLKNGGGMFHIELFYTKFFSHHFASRS